MNDDSPTWFSYRRTAWVLVFVTAAASTALFGFASKRQLPYLVSGREADATVTQMRSKDGYTLLPRFRGPADVWKTEYSFAEPDGTARTGSDEVPVPTDLNVGHTVRVRYTPGPDGGSMIVSDRSRFALWGFAGSVGACIVVIALALLPFVRRFGAVGSREVCQSSVNP